MSKSVSFLLIVLWCISCSESKKSSGQEVRYYDLGGYFGQQISILNRTKPFVQKTVVHNGTSGQKKLQIEDWTTELELFRASDINKSSWKDSFTADSSGSKIVYTAKDEQLRTRKIEILFNHKEVTQINIWNQTDNFLYHTREKLTYFPDSLYRIHKTQKVILLGANQYDITAEW